LTLGFPLDSSFDREAYLNMVTSMLIHYPRVPHANVTYSDILDMDLDVFQHLQETLQEVTPKS
jgi:hypothetical protein